MEPIDQLPLVPALVVAALLWTFVLLGPALNELRLERVWRRKQTQMHRNLDRIRDEGNDLDQTGA